jgi:class 3 adenylate cyclase/tetratricopeptide (TPR) repeat protein
VLACPQCGHRNPEGARFCNACAAPLVAAEPKARKTVSIVRCDVTGSTALGERLDPEPLQGVMTRYFDEMRAVIERHGGTVEKFIGDAVMAVFGVPVLHEDDALRAVRAAAEMREALERLNDELKRERGVQLQVRTGVTTGEVIAGDPSAGQAFVTGDAANVAARLETSAQPGEILLGEATHRLVSAAVEAEAVEPLTAKGKAEPLRAWRLLAVRPGVGLVARRMDVPMVGRRSELAKLLAIYEHAKSERSCQLVTIVGEPGIGKSRLSEELAHEVSNEAMVLRGRCLPYGEGITYWPLIEILRAAAQSEERAQIAELLRGEPDADLIAGRVAAAVGTAEAGAASEETFWAIRQLFERLGRRRPLVLLIDDLQWAERTFFELLEHIVYLSRAAPIVLVGLARSGLLEIRPEWPGPRISLEPLLTADAEALMDTLAGEKAVGEEVRARIATAAEGNPLFIEQMLAMLEDDGSGVAVPPTIQALLAARLDQLDGPERRAVQCASVVGQEFWSGAVRDLSGDDVGIGRALIALVRHQLVVPAESVTFPDEDAFRFVHLLVRDAAYEAIPKELRSELHQRFAAWIERKDEERGVQHEEIVGYHLEQAFQYLEELGPTNTRSRLLAEQAAERLLAAGRKSLARDDTAAAANLFSRAVRLLSRHDPARLGVLPDLAEALVRGGELARAREVLDGALRDARAAGDRRAEAHAQIVQEGLLDMTDPEGVVERIPRVVAEAIRVFEMLGDDPGLARAWQLSSRVGWTLCRFAESAAGVERALIHAERAHNRLQAAELRKQLFTTLSSGRTPVDEVAVRGQAMLDRVKGDPLMEAAFLAQMGLMEAYRGNFGRARELTARRESIYTELGIPLAVAMSKWFSGAVAMVAGDPAMAERKWREGCDIYVEVGERGFLSTVAAELAEKALYVLGKYDEAEQFVKLAREKGASDDVETQARWRGARAKLLARRGDFEAAERLAHEAVALTKPTDYLVLQGDVLMDLAEVLRLASRSAEAASAARRAQETYEAKGMVVAAKEAANFVEELKARQTSGVSSTSL